MNAPLRSPAACHGGPMIRISLPYIYGLSEALDPVLKLRPGSKLSDVFYELYNAQNAVETLMRSSVFALTLKSSRTSATALIEALKAVIGDPDRTFDREIETYKTYSITSAASQFKIALMAELGVLPAYFVTQKEGFDTLSLLDDGYKFFPADLTAKVPEAFFDMTEAGKSLAYELPTAAGFHIFRVMESVLRRYYTHVTGGLPMPKVRSISVYVRAIRSAKVGDEKILGSLEMIAKFHRNPLVHPEAALTLDEAIATLGIARSVVTAMLSVLPKLPQTTSGALPVSTGQVS